MYLVERANDQALQYAIPSLCEGTLTHGWRRFVYTAIDSAARSMPVRHCPGPFKLAPLLLSTTGTLAGNICYL